MTGLLDELIDRIDAMPPDQQAEVINAARRETGLMKWVPLPGPQSDAYFSEADELFYGGSAGGGKALYINTFIPTPSGWSSMEDLQAGDQVFDECGVPCSVTATSEIMYDRPCYRLTFSDGAEIIADADHLWLTLTDKERIANQRADPEWQAQRRSTRASRAKEISQKPWVTASITRINKDRQHNYKGVTAGGIRTTKDIFDTLLAGRRLNHSVCVAPSLRLPTVVLPIEPYLLGAWLGDGTSAGARICMAENEMVEHVTHAAALMGWVVTKGKTKYDYGITGGFKKVMSEAGLLKNKHIPAAYFRASFEQRMALLQGLMDTDGHAADEGNAELCLTNKMLSYQALELIRSLGCKATIRKSDAKLNGIKVSDRYRIQFYAPFPIFRLKRKVERQKMGDFRPTVMRRYIKKVDAVESVPVKCIAVDSPSRLYLAGEHFIPTHNSDLGLGLAINEHTKSLVLRREREQVHDLFERIGEILDTDQGRNGQLLRWDIGDKTIRCNGVKTEQAKQKHKGRPYSFYHFDEIGDFLKSQYTFIITWNRSTVPGERCRVLCTGNPPTTAEGLWVIEYWGAWLDPKHPNPAKEGELRWYIMDKSGKQHEVEGRGPHTVQHDDGSTEELFARSRTFIRAWLKDNPYLAKTDYGAALDRLDPALRAAYRDGRFDLSLEDNPRQVIPVQWIIEAQKRWTPKPPAYIPMSAIGVDPAQGGPDETALAPRYDGWYAPLSVTPGAKTPNGASVVAKIIEVRRDAALPIVDLGGGYGGATKEKLEDNQIPVEGFKPAGGSTARSNCKSYSFKNQRAQAYWKFREALDPSQPGGSQICLPDDPKLVADLSAPTFTISRGKNGLEILIESKEDIKERLGRSPDRGDAVVIAWTDGAKSDSHGKIWHEAKQARMNGPRVVMGHQSQRRR